MNSIIMADDLAFELGEFFADLKNATDWELTNFGINNNIVCHTSFLDGSYNASSLAEPIAKINNCPFLCFIYAHGQEDSVFLVLIRCFLSLIIITCYRMLSYIHFHVIVEEFLQISY